MVVVDDALPAVVALKSVTSMTPDRRGFSRETARMASVSAWPKPVVRSSIAPQRAFIGHVKAHQAVVGFDQGCGSLFAAVSLRQAVDFVVEDVRYALEKDQRQDVILVFGGIHGAMDLAGSIPQPLFEGREIKMIVKKGRLLGSLIGHCMNLCMLSDKFGFRLRRR